MPAKGQVDENSLLQKARRAGKSPGLVYNRIRAGWTEEQALRIWPRVGMTHAERKELGLKPGYYDRNV